MLKTLQHQGRVGGEVNDRRQIQQSRRAAAERTAIVESSEYATVSARVEGSLAAMNTVEEQLLHAYKMEAIGTLTGGIAHDFSNLLSVIRGYTDVLEDHSSDETTVTDLIGEIRTAVCSATALTGQLLAFSRKQAPQPQIVSLNEVVSKTVTILQRVLREDIILNLHFDPGEGGNVFADFGQLQQVIINLAVNARDAMPKGGILTMATENVDLECLEVAMNPSVQPGSYVRLMVSDTGIGMDEATMQNAFEPFFTTKAAGRGSGMGLAIVYGIAKHTGGGVRLSSKVGEGTVVEVYLPRLARTPVAHVPIVSALPKRGDETILLVEDHFSLRKLLGRGLEKHGYTVIAAEHGQGALELAKSRNKRIDLLITDVIMPGMDGRELARTLSEQRPDIRVLYMSGHPDEMLGDIGLITSDAPLIRKPFELRNLYDEVRKALETAKPGSRVPHSQS